MNKQGSLVDSIYMPIYLLLVACTIFIAYFVWTTFVTNFTPIATAVTMPDGRNLTAITTEITLSLSYLDYMFPFLVLGLLLVSLIFAFKSGASIIYAYISIFMWVLALLISAILTNIFEIFAAQFASIGGTFVMISYVMANIKWVCLAWAFLISLVMFTRSNAESQQNVASERMFG